MPPLVVVVIVVVVEVSPPGVVVRVDGHEKESGHPRSAFACWFLRLSLKIIISATGIWLNHLTLENNYESRNKRWQFTYKFYTIQSTVLKPNSNQPVYNRVATCLMAS